MVQHDNTTRILWDEKGPIGMKVLTLQAPLTTSPSHSTFTYITMGQSCHHLNSLRHTSHETPLRITSSPKKM